MRYLINFYITNAFEILTVLWIFSVARSILFWLNYIQIKQYRLDRIWAELKGRNIYRIIFSSYRSILIGFLIAWQLLLRTSVSSQVGAFDLLLTAIIAFFLFQAIRTVKYLYDHTLQIPSFTLKIWVLFIGLLSVEIWISSIYQFWPEQLIAIEIIQPLIVLIAFAILFIPNFFLQHLTIKKAREKRIFHKDLIVIGITGSYGKSTMKDYLSHILSQKFSVLKTPKHINVDTGIARLVTEELLPTHEIFIVEMGAYRKGEIQKISDIVLPQYGVLTGLDNQHLELFGSLETIKNTKFELVDAVHDENKLFANADSEPLMAAFNQRNIKPITFGLAHDAQYFPENLTYKDNGISFSISENSFSAPIFGAGQLTNLIGAITVAKKLGMSFQSIAEAIRTIPIIERSMQLKPGLNQSIYIDDSYNANRQGILTSFKDIAAMNVNKRILIFREIIELGDEGKSTHIEIAQAAAKLFDYVLLLNSELQGLMRKTLLEGGFSSDNILHPIDIERLRNLLDKDTAVLFEGRGAENILSKLN